MITNDKGSIPKDKLYALPNFGRKKYTCPKGHEWEAWGTLTYGYEKVVTDALCPACIRDFLNTNFPAKEVSDD